MAPSKTDATPLDTLDLGTGLAPGARNWPHGACRAMLDQEPLRRGTRPLVSSVVGAMLTGLDPDTDWRLDNNSDDTYIHTPNQVDTDTDTTPVDPLGNRDRHHTRRAQQAACCRMPLPCSIE